MPADDKSSRGYAGSPTSDEVVALLTTILTRVKDQTIQPLPLTPKQLEAVEGYKNLRLTLDHTRKDGGRPSAPARPPTSQK